MTKNGVFRLFTISSNLTFIDNSQLFIKEYLFENYDRKYAYHWTDDSGKLICRWDNANHWTDISTFPHHKHLGNQVLDSTEISLDDVLAIICEQISNYTAE